MKFKALQESLLDALKVHKPDKKPMLPILTCVLIEAFDSGLVQFTTTTIEASVRTEIKAAVEVSGKMAVDFHTLRELIAQSSPEHVIFEEKDTFSCKVSVGTSKSIIKGFDPDEFPTLWTFEGEKIEVKRESFIQDLAAVSHCMAKNNSGRPILEGTLLEFSKGKMYMASADGYRLALVNRDHNEESISVKCVIPSSSIARIISAMSQKNMEDVLSIYVSPGLTMLGFQSSVNGCTYEVATQLLEGRYPDWSAIVRGISKTEITIGKAAFLQQLKGAEIFGRDSANSAKFDVESSVGTLTVQSRSAERGNQEGIIKTQINGEELSMNGNVKYMIHAVSTFNSDGIVIHLNKSNEPFILNANNDDGYIVVIMPMSKNG